MFIILFFRIREYLFIDVIWEHKESCWSFKSSVADPHVFGPPGSGSFYQQAKKVRKTLVPVTSFWLFVFENDVNVPSKSNKQKKFYNFFFLASWRSMTKIAGSISQRHGSADLDPDPQIPHQHVMDPQHWPKIPASWYSAILSKVLLHVVCFNLFQMCVNHMLLFFVFLINVFERWICMSGVVWIRRGKTHESCGRCQGRLMKVPVMHYHKLYPCMHNAHALYAKWLKNSARQFHYVL